MLSIQILLPNEIKNNNPLIFFCTNFQGYNLLPICMAKTSNSLTADPTIKGAPVGFKIVVNDIFISAGAGFIVPICGDIAKMPGKYIYDSQ